MKGDKYYGRRCIIERCYGNMLKLYIEKNIGIGFILTGHAKRDAICAAVSALSQTAILGLSDRSDLHYIVRNGYTFIHIDNPDSKSQIIIDTIVKGIQKVIELDC